jgi:hypothetical protein
MSLLPTPNPKRGNPYEDKSDVANPLALPSITGGSAGPATAGASGASAKNTISGGFSVGGSSATETLKSIAFPVLMVGGVVFLGALFLRGR